MYEAEPGDCEAIKSNGLWRIRMNPGGVSSVYTCAAAAVRATMARTHPTGPSNSATHRTRHSSDSPARHSSDSPDSLSRAPDSLSRAPDSLSRAPDSPSGAGSISPAWRGCRRDYSTRTGHELLPIPGQLYTMVLSHNTISDIIGMKTYRTRNTRTTGGAMTAHTRESPTAHRHGPSNPSLENEHSQPASGVEGRR